MSAQIKAIRTTSEEVTEPGEMLSFAQQFLVELAGRAFAESSNDSSNWKGQENAKIAERARKALRILRGEALETEVQASSVKGNVPTKF